MNAAYVGYFVGAFLIGLLIFAICLGFFKIIPPLRRRHGLAYGVSGGLACAALLLTATFPHIKAPWVAIAAAVAMLGLAFLGYSQATRATIVKAEKLEKKR